MQLFHEMVNGIGNATFSLVLGLLDGVVLRIGFSWLLGDYLGMEQKEQIDCF